MYKVYLLTKKAWNYLLRSHSSSSRYPRTVKTVKNNERLKMMSMPKYTYTRLFERSKKQS
jgi:hypothetical protein